MEDQSSGTTNQQVFGPFPQRLMDENYASGSDFLPQHTLKRRVCEEINIPQLTRLNLSWRKTEDFCGSGLFLREVRLFLLIRGKSKQEENVLVLRDERGH
ncbi:hypothetical protein AVEN_21281-1 [Araneus ventricosus]|uniref:Uncharacterized protein n=1 Tax=Araneus ventricosus TaxID=182803 RepID=A0A4Y2KCS4_ARAVE|nr:hypothetical protein AVEN_21281-1 [Araneus ventricosus]